MKGLVATLKEKRKELLDAYEAPEDAVIIENTPKYFKMHIKDYMEVGLYSDLIDRLDPDKISDKISFSLLWNVERQRIARGVFYVIIIGDNIYNIWLDDLNLKLDERIKVGEETHERIINIHTSTEKFHFTSLKHDKIGSTYYTMYYHYPKETLVPPLSFSKDEALKEINEVLDNFCDIEVVNSIINIEEIRNIILRNLNPSPIKLEKIDK